jgi:biopolymer transport protein TolR
MGMSAGSGDKKAVQSEINVTPLIDVLLVLLIIFLVVMPIMVKMETLEVPRKIQENEAPDPNAVMLTIKVAVAGNITFIENEKETSIPEQDLIKTLRPKLEQVAQRGADRVVFVDFEDMVPWAKVMGAMDSIRSLANDVNHDGIKVALKIKEEPK